MAPKGSMTYAFTHMGDFLLLRLLRTPPPPSLEAHIPALRPKSHPRGPNPSKEVQSQEEKIPHMCESIGHRPLRGRCPAPPSTTIITHSCRARVPLTIQRFCDYLVFHFTLILSHLRLNRVKNYGGAFLVIMASDYQEGRRGHNK